MRLYREQPGGARLRQRRTRLNQCRAGEVFIADFKLRIADYVQLWIICDLQSIIYNEFVVGFGRARYCAKREQSIVRCSIL